MQWQHNCAAPETHERRLIAAQPRQVAVLDALVEGGYEQVLFCQDAASGLRSIIVIHDTTLGPAFGGVRMRPYPHEADALADCLRLAGGRAGHLRGPGPVADDRARRA